MKSLLYAIVAVSLLGAGTAGRLGTWPAVLPYAWWFVGAGAAMLLRCALRATYCGAARAWPMLAQQPQPLVWGWLTPVKLLICWLDAFSRTYAVEPGLYYTGAEYDRDAPLLTTSNYLLTVFLVARQVRSFNARLLVVDTDGINVWCAAGKGRFGDAAVAEQLERYERELLTSGEKVELVLPKLALAGIDVRALRQLGVRPIIGPIHARELPAYLAHPPLKDRDEDRVVFGLPARLFTWLPGLLQAVAYSLMAALALCVLALFGGPRVPIAAMAAIAALLATLYPILFPWLPGVRFAVKGLWLAALLTLAWSGLWAADLISGSDLALASLFTFASGLFFGQLYTGNSAVSNYTRVRREIARFLPIYLGLYVGALAFFLLRGTGP